MASTIGYKNTSNSDVSTIICRIVGIVCLAGFTVDFVVLALPPNPFLLEWRINFLQQISDRSIILLIGFTLTFYAYVNSRWLRPLSLSSMLIGLLLALSCLVMVRDVSSFQQQSLGTINEQAAQIQDRIQQVQSNSSRLPQNITPEQLAQASQQVTDQAEALKKNAKALGVRSAVASVGSLLIAGLGLMTVGRYGVRLRRR